MEKKIYFRFEGVKMKKDLIKKLKMYKMYKAKRNKKQFDLEELENSDIAAINYNEKAATNIISSQVENKAIKIIELKKEINEYDTEIKKIENLLSVLNESEKIVIESKYIEERRYEGIINSLDRRYTTIKNIENKAFKKMIEVLKC